MTAIGTVRRITPADPRITRNSPALEWAPTPDGIQILDSRAGSSVFVEFRQRPPEFTVTPFDAAKEDYQAGDLVYYDATGECYQSLADFPQHTPADTSEWRKIDMPYALAEAVKRFVYAMALEEDGQQDKAKLERDGAEDTLATEWSKHESQQGQVRHFTALTR